MVLKNMCLLFKTTYSQLLLGKFLFVYPCLTLRGLFLLKIPYYVLQLDLKGKSTLPSAGNQEKHESLHETQHASCPPAARHDYPAHRPTAVVVVRPWPVAPVRLTNPLTMGVTAITFCTANATMVQHGIEHHVPL